MVRSFNLKHDVKMSMSYTLSQLEVGVVCYSYLVSQARLTREERVRSNSHHHLVSNMPRISWRVIWVSDEWRRAVAFFGMLFRETEDLPLQNVSQFSSHLFH